ncbi:unknown protein [Microcystis aeruginosa NIES-843]|uniref:Uncharacterized protein n=1 Tax=Microcystis aeruginosa (strain NIES-843 / IAM M-2473) TaxID=449447 RepID=B0JVS2_MICAN|nr:unknown protein [Microcystis aeruginosa NIES-843]
MGKIYILDSQIEGFSQSQPATIKQLNDKMLYATEVLHDILHFFFGEDGGQAFVTFCP